MHGSEAMPRFSLLCSLSSCLLVSCAEPTDSTDDGVVERERVEVFGPISEDVVWERGKEYYVIGDVTVQEGVTLSLLDPSRDPAGCGGKVYVM